mmetsp:Transcript_28660/g.95229  ORF Transcript_28660/g.95229 Transcript_28660/m.95229 type:complete len:226 (-) Transcript_28660:526-1203(-)
MRSAGSTSSFRLTSLVIMRTRCAKRHVEMDSSVWSEAGCIAATITVLQLPPSESRSTDVSMLLRYGTCVSLPPPRPALPALALSLSCRRVMTSSRKWSERLMWSASPRVVPLAPVLATRSEPARSTSCSFERRTVGAPTGRASTCTVKTQCERDDAAFIAVSQTARLVSPTKRRESASSSLAATWQPRPRRCTPPSSSSATALMRGSVKPSPAAAPPVGTAPRRS